MKDIYLNRVSEIIINDTTDMNSLFRNIERCDSKNFAIKQLDNVDDEKYMELMGFLQRRNVDISFRGNDISLLQKMRDIVILIDYNKDIVSQLYSLVDTNNHLYLRCEPLSYKEFYDMSIVIENLEKEFPYLSFIFSLERMTDHAGAFNHIREFSEDFQKKILICGIGKCFMRDTDFFSVSVHSLFDIKEKITDKGIEILPGAFKIKEQKKSSMCKDCSRSKSCVGISRVTPFTEIAGTYESLNKDYVSVLEFYKQRNHQIQTGILALNPYHPENSYGNSVLESLQRRRNLSNFKGPNHYYVWNFERSFYFNRPLQEQENMWQQDPRGIPSINWQFIGRNIPELQWKQKCDLLVPEHGVVTTAKIEFDDEWSEKKQKALDDFTFETLKHIILENGGDRNLLVHQGNDLLYNGKKFAGKEWQFTQNAGYIENVVITCSYIKEKEWFDKLYHWSGEKQITGITDEVPSITKELLIEELYKESLIFFDD